MARRALELLVASHQESQRRRNETISQGVENIQRNRLNLLNFNRKQEGSLADQLIQLGRVRQVAVDSRNPDLLARTTAAINSLSGNRQTTQPQAFTQPPAGQAFQGGPSQTSQTTNVPRPAVPSTSPDSFISPGQFDPFTGKQTSQSLKRQEVEKQVAAQEQKARAEETRGAERTVTGTGRFLQQVARSAEELSGTIPDFGKVGVSGKATRLLLSLGEKVDLFPETSVLVREAKKIANQSARDVEGGRVTDQDRAIYAEAMANTLTAPSQTNVRLTSNALIDLADKGGDISSVVQELSVSSIEIMQSISEQVFKEFPELKPASKMSEEELQKIARGS